MARARLMREPRATAALERAIHRYREAPLLARALVQGRAWLSDLPFIERYVPRQGLVVDLGCGHGLFANLLVEASPQRSVVGMDIDVRKIAVARATVRGRRTLRFEVGDAVTDPVPRCDAITIVDVLYLMPFAQQERLLRNAARALEHGQPLVVKAQERSLTLRYLLTYVQELVTVGLGLTRGGRGPFYFSTREQAIEMFRRAGLVPEVIEMPGRPYTDVLFVAHRDT